MIYKLYFAFLVLFSLGPLFSQNNQLLFDFDQLPQTLMLNPGAEVSYNKHLGIPFLSNIYAQAGATNKNFTYNNIFANADSNILKNIYDQDLKQDDFFIFNQQWEILNAGLRLKNEDYYVSFGITQKSSGYSAYPEDLANLYFNGNDQNGDGNPELNQDFNFNQINFIGELINVFHIGISKKINNNFTVGARFKLLSGSVNIDFTKVSGVYSLDDALFGYEHYFNNMNVSFRSSGVLNLNGESILNNFSEQLKGLFFLNGNIGAGLDLGLTYHIKEDIIFTASLLDLDFINYSNEVIEYEINNDFVLNDSEYFAPPEGGESTYWENKINDFYNDGFIPLDTLQTSYISTRAPKLNMSAKYQIFRSSSKKYNSVFRDARFVTPIQKVLVTEFGVQTYTAFYPQNVDWAVTAFAARDLNQYIKVKLAYTYNQFSATNIGLGFSTHINKFNFYATADNLVALFKIKDSNYQSVQFGMNFIIY